MLHRVARSRVRHHKLRGGKTPRMQMGRGVKFRDRRPQRKIPAAMRRSSSARLRILRWNR